MAPADLAARAGLIFQDPERQFLATRVADEIALGLPSADRAGAAAPLEALGPPPPPLGARAAAGTAILAATHDERFVAAFASRVLELHAGRLVAECAP